MLAREVARPTWRREHVALGTNTDPYQRAEGRYQLMPGIIKALAGSGTPFSILTKGTLLSRDLPELPKAAAGRTARSRGLPRDPRRRAARGPRAGHADPRARLALVRALRDAGLPCGVMLAPVLPWLTDDTEHLDQALGSLGRGRRDRGHGPAAAPAAGRQGVVLRLAGPRAARPRQALRGAVRAQRQRPASYRRSLAARVQPLLERYGFAKPGAGIRGIPDDAPSSLHGSLPSLEDAPAPPPDDQLSLL